MKIPTTSLRTALTSCASPTRGRLAQLPILKSVRLEADNGVLKLQTTNLDVFIERTAECEDELQPCCVNLELLHEAIKNVQGDSCQLNLDGRLLLTDGKSVTRFNIIDAATFPAWPTSKLVKTAVNCADLAEGLGMVDWACAEEGQKRYDCENVLVKLLENFINCVATSGRVLAVWLKPSIAAKCEFRIPVKFVPPLIAALQEPHSLLAVGESYVECSHEQGRTMCKLSELEFVKGWEKILEARAGHLTAKLSTEAVSRLCSLCMSYHSEQRYPQIDFAWNGKVVAVEINGDVATASQEIPATGKGSGEAHSNAKYLAKALAKMGEEVKFTPCDNASYWESGNLCAVVMQLRAQVRV